MNFIRKVEPVSFSAYYLDRNTFKIYSSNPIFFDSTVLDVSASVSAFKHGNSTPLELGIFGFGVDTTIFGPYNDINNRVVFYSCWIQFMQEINTGFDRFVPSHGIPVLWLDITAICE